MSKSWATLTCLHDWCRKITPTSEKYAVPTRPAVDYREWETRAEDAPYNAFSSPVQVQCRRKSTVNRGVCRRTTATARNPLRWPSAQDLSENPGLQTS